MINMFWEELKSSTSPCGEFMKHGEVLLKCRMLDEKVLRVSQLISFSPFESNRTGKFLCNLADKYGIVIEGKAEPMIVGPSVTKNGTFFVGMDKERLMKWYSMYGFEIVESNDKYFQIKRRPKNENTSKS